MSMKQHVTAVAKSAFYHLTNIIRIRKYNRVSHQAEILIHDFVTSRLNFFNSLPFNMEYLRMFLKELSQFRMQPQGLSS